MLRACQRAAAQLQGTVSSGVLGARWFSVLAEPGTGISTVKPFDPAGPLSQFDNLAEGLDRNDPFVKIALEMKELKVAKEKLESERAQVQSLLLQSRRRVARCCQVPPHSGEPTTRS